MTHTIEINWDTVKHVGYSNGVHTRKFLVLIDNVPVKARLLFVKCKPRQGHYPYSYRLYLDNKLVRQNEDYKYIRFAILEELMTQEQCMNEKIIHREAREI